MRYSFSAVAKKYGFRSGLEHSLSQYLTELEVPYLYEAIKIEWEDLAYRTYTPDFILQNGILVETKGLFTTADRRKHLFIKNQHPAIDLRFVFENSRRKIRKGAKSTYGDWCHKHGFKYADKVVPDEWLNEDKGKHVVYPSFVPYKAKKKERRNGR